MTKNYFNEENFQLQLNQNIKKKIQCHVLTLLQDYLELCNKESGIHTVEQPDAMRQIQFSIMDTIGRLPDILALHPGERDNLIQPFLDDKETLRKISLELLAYHERVIFLQKASAHYTKKSFFQQNPNVDRPFSTLIDSCFNFFMESSDGIEERYRMASILSCFPVRMTRENYYDYVEKSIELMRKISDGTLNRESLLYLEVTCNPNHPKFNFNTFPEIKSQLDELEEMDLEEITDEKRDLLGEQLDDIKMLLMSIDDFTNIFLECINALITIFTFSMDMDYLFDDNFVYKDLYFTIKEGIDANAHDMNYELFGQTLEFKIEEQLDTLIDEIHVSDLQCQQTIDTLNFDTLSDNCSKLYEAFFTINHLYLERSNDHNFCLYKAPLHDDSETVDEISSVAFLHFFKACMATKTPKKQRLAKQFFLAELASPFTPEEFSAYVHQSFDASPSLRQLIMADVMDTLTVNGFDLQHHEHEEHEHHHKHAHDDDCDCGHDHHHHH